MYCRFGYKRWQCGFYVHDVKESGVQRLVEFLQELLGFFTCTREIAAYRKEPPALSLQWATRNPFLAMDVAEALRDDACWSGAKQAAHVFDLHPPMQGGSTPARSSAASMISKPSGSQANPTSDDYRQ